MSLNEQALQLFEQNEYDRAFTLMKQAATETPGVESLNNLAWLYLREEEDMGTAKVLLNQTILLNPNSPFPYTMLGEIALKEGQLDESKEYLTQSINIQPSDEAIHNLAIVYFKRGCFKEAATYFQKVAKDSDMVRLNEVVSRISAGESEVAKILLDAWNEEADDYTGAIEIADVYIEINCFEEACLMFEKEWESYYCMPYIVSRYAYTLLQLGKVEACKEIINKAIAEKVNEMEEEQQSECDEHWSEADKIVRILELQHEKETLSSLFERLQQGFVPPFEYNFYPAGGCQLFACKQHGNAGYIEKEN